MFAPKHGGLEWIMTGSNGNAIGLSFEVAPWCDLLVE
jgi:hypothetical protein